MDGAVTPMGNHADILVHLLIDKMQRGAGCGSRTQQSGCATK
jgi:hypothetical protein